MPADRNKELLDSARALLKVYLAESKIDDYESGAREALALLQGNVAALIVKLGNGN